MAGQDPDRNIRISKGDGYWRGQFLAMASPCEVLSESSDAAEAERLTSLAATEVWRIEDKFSRYLDGNIIDRINRAAGTAIELDDETANLIDFAVTLNELSDGRFDITSGVLRRCWTFDGSDRLPTTDQVANVMESVGWQRVSWRRPELRLNEGMEIDLGGIGKEYAVDQAAALLRAQAPTSCLINLGGDLAVTVPPSGFEHWHIGIESLCGDSAIPANLLNLRVGALATSGDARRFLARDGIRFSHILDPKTGWPVPDAPHSITVAADTCTQAGMLCTLAMLEGQGAEAFLEAQELRFWCSR